APSAASRGEGDRTGGSRACARGGPRGAGRARSRATAVRRRARAGRRQRDRRQPGRAAGQGRVPRSLGGRRTQRDRCADIRLCRAAQRAGRQQRAAGPAADDDHRARRLVGGRELQGKPARPHPHRPAGDDRGRCLRRRRRVQGQGRRSRGRHRIGIRAAAAAERIRQLDQGRAARTGADRARLRTTGEMAASHRAVDARARRHQRAIRRRARHGAGRRAGGADRRVCARYRTRRCRGRRDHCGEPSRRGLSMSGTPSAAPAPQPPPLHGVPLVALTVAISFATFMEVLDITIVNVSVPHIAGSLGVSPQEGTWAISSYSLASAIMQPLSGWLGRRFGEVRCFVVSALLFVLMSVLCGLATSMPMLIVGRLLQGAGSGPMVALSLSLLLNNYPNEKKGLALALWAMTVVVAPIFGPILGGWLTDNYSWPWIFYINVPVGLLAIVVTWGLLRRRESTVVKVPIDTIGLVLLVVGVGCLQFMLDNGNDKDWFASPLIVTLGVVALVCLVFLVAWELTDKHPVVDLS